MPYVNKGKHECPMCEKKFHTRGGVARHQRPYPREHNAQGLTKGMSGRIKCKGKESSNDNASRQTD